MSETEEPKQDEPQKDEHGCLDNEIWNEQQNKCVPKPQEPAEEGPAAEKGATLETRVFTAMEAIMKSKCAETAQRILMNVDAVLDAKARAIDQTLRKGFGVESSSVVHMSDLIGIGRKAALEKADTGKRTPAVETGGPEGTLKPDAIQKMFRNAQKGLPIEP